jgi:2-oxoglutarate dehydrogenase E2 component (dihydrolipoamide succinyltransferase)
VLPESIPSVTLLDWHKREGEAVERDEILIELETDKVVVEVPAPESGVLAEILKKAGDTAESQEVIARIDPGEKPTAVKAQENAPLKAIMSKNIDIKVPDIADFSEVEIIDVLVREGETIEEMDPENWTLL